MQGVGRPKGDAPIDERVRHIPPEVCYKAALGEVGWGKVPEDMLEEFRDSQRHPGGRIGSKEREWRTRPKTPVGVATQHPRGAHVPWTLRTSQLVRPARKNQRNRLRYTPLEATFAITKFATLVAPLTKSTVGPRLAACATANSWTGTSLRSSSEPR